MTVQCVCLVGGVGEEEILICAQARYWCVSGMSAPQGSVFGVLGEGGFSNSSAVCRSGVGGWGWGGGKEG